MSCQNCQNTGVVIALYDKVATIQTCTTCNKFHTHNEAVYFCKRIVNLAFSFAGLLDEITPEENHRPCLNASIQPRPLN